MHLDSEIAAPGSEPTAIVTVFTDELVAFYQDKELVTRREELQELIATAGGWVVKEFTQRLAKPRVATFIGKGKGEEIARAIAEEQTEAVVFNHDLSPRQQRELEEMIDAKIIDRTRLILDIFAQRASSKEGQLQVELAQLSYLLPRLTGRGEELSRLAGGIGTRGPGETKLETDRRRIRRRMTDVRREISEIRSHRSLLRANRQRSRTPVFALVGYTNAGKSTLLNRLTASDLPTQDKLFATLDPAIRRVELPHSISARLVDTVGFIRDLPEDLLEAFKATLEEVSEADFLLHVVDASHEYWRDQVMSVIDILRELGVLDKPTVTVLNKIDRLEAPLDPGLVRSLPRPVRVSALVGTNLEQLKNLMAELVQARHTTLTVEIPYDHMDLLDELHQHGEIHAQDYQGEGVRVTVTIEDVMAQQVASRLGASAVSEIPHQPRKEETPHDRRST